MQEYNSDEEDEDLHKAIREANPDGAIKISIQDLEASHVFAKTIF